MICDSAGNCPPNRFSDLALTLERYRDGITPDNNW